MESAEAVVGIAMQMQMKQIQTDSQRDRRCRRLVSINIPIFRYHCLVTLLSNYYAIGWRGSMRLNVPTLYSIVHSH